MPATTAPRVHTWVDLAQASGDTLTELHRCRAAVRINGAVHMGTLIADASHLILSTSPPVTNDRGDGLTNRIVLISPDYNNRYRHGLRSLELI